MTDIGNISNTELRKLEYIALQCAERNLTNGIWKVETAQLFLRTVAEQPEEHLYLLEK